MNDRLLKGNEVAERLNISKAFAYRLIAAGDMPAIRLGRSVRGRAEDLEKFIEASASKGDEVVLPS